MKNLILLLLAAGVVIQSCRNKDDIKGLHFTILPSSQTGVLFNNTITEDDSTNMFVNEYTYMGGGVATADFNNDGLEDIFFAGSQVSSKLYLNKGAMHFEDITEKAGVATRAWCTGVSVADINNDGWPDIYVCVSGKVPGSKRGNLLFINQHNLTFKEEAAEYGLSDTSYSTQAVFFDYDNDGRLDMYLLNHALDDSRPNDMQDNKTDATSIASDKLFHNVGDVAGTGHPVFKDVSKQAGIIEDGDGLGVIVSDLNKDGYPDIYVCNDYIRNDVMWLNNKNGTFTNCIANAVKHQSYSSMGTDAADINNDDWPDIITLDMQPETNERKKMMYSFLSEQRHEVEMNKGYQPQFIHNMLQLNNGTRTMEGNAEPYFSEIGEMAGIAETDWSWSVLIADLDNDGWKDVHITNGLGRDPTNIDFLEYRHNMAVQTGLPDNDAKQRKGFVEHLASMGPLLLRNYLYLNKGGQQFEDVSLRAGIADPSISNGAAYADLDNDGRLDIVTNNINSDAFIMHNDSRDNGDKASNNYLAIKLAGDSLNRYGIGAAVYCYSKAGVQLAEQYPVRGYLSTVDERLHFGLGANTVDSVKVIWPGGKEQLIKQPAINRLLQVNINDALLPAASIQDSAAMQIFKEVTGKNGTDFWHKETFFFDYQFQPLIPQKYSQEGPFISTGDVNGDGLEDFFIGGAYNQPGKVFLQQPGGTFTGKELVAGTKNEEDMQSIIFDANGDSKPDLLIAGGSSEFEITSSYYRPRLYLNDGDGNFHLDETAFSPVIRTPAKCIAAADMDGDGDTDIFIGGRVALGTYPKPPRSYLLRNDHGRFTDVTNAVCPALEDAGLLNAVVWADVDGDKKPDLIVAGDWAPVRIFKNNGGTFTEITGTAGLDKLPGLWRSLAVTDVDNDGDPDIVAGNLGLNNPYHITGQHPAQLVAKDFDGNGIIEPVFCYAIKNNNGDYELSCGISRDEWARQMPSIKKRFEQNAAFAKATMQEIFTQDMMAGAMVLHCNEVRNGYFENNGKGVFAFHPFPLAAQTAPINTLVCSDINGDGIKDIVAAGNEYQAKVSAGRYDACYGYVLLGMGKGAFAILPPRASGLIIDGDTKDLKLMHTSKGLLLLAAVNNAVLKCFSIK